MDNSWKCGKVKNFTTLHTVTGKVEKSLILPLYHTTKQPQQLKNADATDNDSIHSLFCRMLIKGSSRTTGVVIISFISLCSEHSFSKEYCPLPSLLYLGNSI